MVHEREAVGDDRVVTDRAEVRAGEVSSSFEFHIVPGWSILRALIAGETDPMRLADVARGTLKTKRAALIDVESVQLVRRARFL